MDSPESFNYEIAVVGMAGRFPKARNLAEYWENLRDGVEAITLFSDEELRASGVDAATLSDPNYVKACAVLDDVEMFDAPFFGFTPREAEIMDPQHRLFLEHAWEALESAGYDSEAYPGRIGVFAGLSANSYLFNNLLPNRDLRESVGGYQAAISNDSDYLATQVSYKLNLKGPSFTVQTACSTSLVAVHLACQSLLNRECDMAMAGGVSVRLPQKQGYFYQDGGILSPDGHCRAFDEKAQGTISGSGVGVAVLKRLADAIKDGDTVYAVIKGSAINNDGSLKVGFTAPSVSGQAAVIEEALSAAMVDPETITYVEAHGTATALGDPIEVAALTQAFRGSTDKKGFCAIGSVKTNMGHLDAAAGVASLLKVVLMLKHKALPPSLNFEKPNPGIDFLNSPFYVNDRLRDWGASPRRAGVSSFGIGGTNAHVVLEEAPETEPSAQSKPRHLVVLSARTESALERATSNLTRYLRDNGDANVADLAYTLQAGRRPLEHRRAVVCQDSHDLLAALESPDGARAGKISQDPGGRPVAFVFSGQGTQYVNMAREVYGLEPIFRSQVDFCSKRLRPHLGFDLREVLYPAESEVERAAQQLDQTATTQPALFVVEYALSKLLIEWGVRPQAMIGHSIGEYVAACLAGVFSLEDALSLVSARGRLMQQLPTGAMLAVPLSEQRVQRLIENCSGLALAAVNAPLLCIVSGPIEATIELEHRLGAEDITCRRLRTSHAFHSQMMEPILGTFAAQVEKVKLNAPAIPYVSNVTGTWITPAEATDPKYWAAHLRHAVRFHDGVSELLKQPAMTLLEVGPGHTLASSVGQYQDSATERAALPTMRDAGDQQSDYAFLLNALGCLWAAGGEIDWRSFHAGERRRRVPLPTYPFWRNRYWVDPPTERRESSPQQEAFERRSDVTDWFYLPSWKRSTLPETDEDQAYEKSLWLVFSDECGFGARMVKRLEEDGEQVVEVKAGAEFSKLNERAYSINPRERKHYGLLLEEVRFLDTPVGAVAHLWNVTPPNETQLSQESFDEAQYAGFYSLIFLAQAIGEEYTGKAMRVGVVSSGLQEITGEEHLSPEKATSLAACRVIPLEYPNITCRAVDITVGESSVADERIVLRLINELKAPASDRTVAYRGTHRWAQVFERFRLGRGAARRARLKEGGVYLLTGRLNGPDLALAELLARRLKAKLVLTGHLDLPERGAWQQWLETHPHETETSRKIKRLLELEALGAEVLVASADVTDYGEMRSIVAAARERFGAINGVIHTAEITGGGLVQLKTPEMSESVFAPKVKGTLVLAEVLKDAPPDFLVLFSSTLALSGVFGQVDYCAANAFLDAFARSANSGRGPFTVSINWNTPQWEDWQEAAMSAVPELQAQLRETRAVYGIGYEDGFEALSRILGSDKHQVVVATQDFQAIADQQNTSTGSGLLNMLEGAQSAQAHSRAGLDTEYEAPRDELEKALVEMWQRLFGIDRVGIHDDFFNLGGNSLLAIQLISQLRKQFKVEMLLSKLFESPTVARLVAVIAASREKQKELDEIERMLKEIEQMPGDEVEANLQHLQSGGEE
jgi:acyl transferase domain-containing protein